MMQFATEYFYYEMISDNNINEYTEHCLLERVNIVCCQFSNFLHITKVTSVLRNVSKSNIILVILNKCEKAYKIILDFLGNKTLLKKG